MKKASALIMVVLLVISFIYNFYPSIPFSKPNQNNVTTGNLTFISLDINPSIELAMDENEIVQQAITLNEDADIAFNNLKLVSTDIKTTVNTIIDTSIKLGYMTEVSDKNAVNVTTYSDDDTKRETINKMIVDLVNNYLEKKTIYALVVENSLDNQLQTEAKLNNISYGKMLFIQRAISLDSTLSQNDLIKLSMNQIQDKIKLASYVRRQAVIEAYRKLQLDFENVVDKKINEAAINLQFQKFNLLTGIINPANLTITEKNKIVNDKKDQIKAEIQSISLGLKQSNVTNDFIQSIKSKYLDSMKY